MFDLPNQLLVKFDKLKIRHVGLRPFFSFGIQQGLHCHLFMPVDLPDKLMNQEKNFLKVFFMAWINLPEKVGIGVFGRAVVLGVVLAVVVGVGVGVICRRTITKKYIFSVNLEKNSVLKKFFIAFSLLACSCSSQGWFFIPAFRLF